MTLGEAACATGISQRAQSTNKTGRESLSILSTATLRYQSLETGCCKRRSSSCTLASSSFIACNKRAACAGVISPRCKASASAAAASSFSRCSSPAFPALLISPLRGLAGDPPGDGDGFDPSPADGEGVAEGSPADGEGEAEPSPGEGVGDEPAPEGLLSADVGWGEGLGSGEPDGLGEGDCPGVGD